MSQPFSTIWGNEVPVGYNVPPTRLSKEVVICGKNVDPFQSGTESGFTVRPIEEAGIWFKIWNHRFQYNTSTLKPMDSMFGRMLSVSTEIWPQALIVEHLISAIVFLGLNNIEIDLDKSCFGPLLSGNIIDRFGLGRDTYSVPVCGPGIYWFVSAMRPYCERTGVTPTIVHVRKNTEFLMREDIQGKYRWLGRKMVIEAHEWPDLSIVIESADQTDIKNCPKWLPYTVTSGDMLTDEQLKARPIMRIASGFSELVIFLLNLSGSYALSHANYFKARPKMTTTEVVARMYEVFQTWQNEHFAHTAIADFPSELWAVLQWSHLHGNIRISNGTHAFRYNAVKNLLVTENIWE